MKFNYDSAHVAYVKRLIDQGSARERDKELNNFSSDLSSLVREINRSNISNHIKILQDINKKSKK